jgi:tetrahydromethanopterin S-methyltransferase subunit F
MFSRLDIAGGLVVSVLIVVVLLLLFRLWLW